MIPGSKGQKAVRACTIKLLNLGPAKYEEVAIYAVNQRIPNIEFIIERGIVMSIIFHESSKTFHLY